MRGVLTTRGPYQEDDSAVRHAQALQPELTVALASIFHRDHGAFEDGLKGGKINLVLAEVLPSLRLIPRDHAQTVYAAY